MQLEERVLLMSARFWSSKKLKIALAQI